jgi:hypothetical protein
LEENVPVIVAMTRTSAAITMTATTATFIKSSGFPMSSRSQARALPVEVDLGQSGTHRSLHGPAIRKPEIGELPQVRYRGYR